MNEDEERCRFVRFDFPEIDVLVLVVAVLNVFESGLDVLGLKRVQEDGEKSEEERDGFVHGIE